MSDQIITEEGYRKLKIELEELEGPKRRKIAGRIERAKELGDLKENAEYHDAKEDLAFNEGRIAEIKELLKTLEVVKSDNGTDTVSLGSKIKVKFKDKQKEFEIVSFNEANPLEGKISNESPLGSAFLGKRKGAKFTVETPRGKAEYEILEIG